MRTKPFEIALVGLMFATPAAAEQVQISDAWIRALPAKLPAAGYFTLRNTGANAVTLTAAKSSACGMLMLHKSMEMGGMGSMEDVSGVAVPAGGTVSFAPGGYHLMCMDSTPALRPGASVPVTLLFKSGEKLTAQFAVRNAAGK